MICASSLASRVWRDLVIISHPFRFVKGFLKSFWKTFFAVLSEPCPSPFGGSARLLYHISFHLSRGFSKVFQLFFVILSGASRRFDPLKSARLLYHISLRLSRGFSKVFSTFFAIFSRVRSLSRGQLAHYSTFMLHCQGGFWKFFYFGSFSSLAQCGWSRLVQHRQPATIFYPDSPFSRRKKPPSIDRGFSMQYRAYFWTNRYAPASSSISRHFPQEQTLPQ